MLESLVRVPDLTWACGRQRPEGLRGRPVTPEGFRGLAGRFAAGYRDGDRVVLVRDPLGLNKLFFAVHQNDGVIAASYLTDLLDSGVPFGSIFAVPAGSAVEITPRTRTLVSRRLHRLRRNDTLAGSDLYSALDHIGADLGRYLDYLARHFPRSPVTVCLSGGLDSALVAALAIERFPAVTAYTYSFAGAGGPSTDAALAQATARYLGLKSRLVPATAADVLAVLPEVIRVGQDWRDFNVHAATVNILLARAIARDHPADGAKSPVIVLTGDLMNELTADYGPVRYRGRDYYRLPAVGHDALRLALTRGLQAGDREVGVFHSRGLMVAQPYAAVFSGLLDLPGSLGKPEVIRGLAGSRLPAAFYRRVKARAQIGGPEVRDGILPVLINSGHDAERLEQIACQLLAAADHRALRRFIRGGAYRACPDYPGRSCGRSGYLTV